jgi:glutathione peroxidase
MNESVFDFSVKNIEGKDISLSHYKGKMLLIVNVASKCGFTPQYAGLEELSQAYQDQLVVLGFPCNQFGQQEPGNEEEIKNFCNLSYNVSFPLFAKVEVNGQNAHPLFDFLKAEKKGLLGSAAIKWNFTKFLVDREGKVLKRYAPTDSPAKIKKDLLQYL